MSRYIDADKAIEYFRKSHKIQTAKIIGNMADSKDYRLGDVVSREQFNEVYEENIGLRNEVQRLKNANARYSQKYRFEKCEKEETE